VESSFEFGIESTGSMKCWETIEWPTSSGLSSSVQLHRVSQSVSQSVSLGLCVSLVTPSVTLH
jgi:hypothetical protein